MSEATTIIHPVNVLTRSECDPGPEWPQLYRELRIACRASERHQSRVDATRHAAALVFASNYEEDSHDRWQAGARGFDESLGDDREVGSIGLTAEEVGLARALVTIDLHGIGGEFGFSGGATARMSWAKLGNARWQAGDGPAWRKAAECAFDAVTNEPSPSEVKRLIIDWVEGFDLNWPLAYAVFRLFTSATPAEASEWEAVALLALGKMTPKMIAPEISGRPWLRALSESLPTYASDSCPSETRPIDARRMAQARFSYGPRYR